MLVMRNAKACFLLAIALSIESAHGILCYHCYGPQCATPSPKNCSSNACFQGSGLVDGQPFSGMTCADMLGSNCVNKTCQTVITYLANIGQTLTNCTGTCCGENLCKGPSPSVTTLPTTLSASTNIQSAPTTESTKPGSGSTSKKSNMFVACFLVWIVLVYNQ